MQSSARTPASFPSHAQQPRARRGHSKARSISSLPNSARGSPLLPSSVNSGIGRLYTASPARQRSPTIHSQPGMPTAPSGSLAIASPRQSPRVRAPARATRPTAAVETPDTANVTSPSKLPSTDGMSYFPPFETMGSVDADTESNDSSAGPSRPTVRTTEKDGASRAHSRGSTPDSRRSDNSQRHGKVRSLGSLGGFMSWATFTPSPAGTPAEAPADGKAVAALTRRTSQAKRRTLEPMQSETFIEWERSVKRNHARRQTVGEADDHERDIQGVSLPVLINHQGPS